MLQIHFLNYAKMRDQFVILAEKQEQTVIKLWVPFLTGSTPSKHITRLDFLSHEIKYYVTSLSCHGCAVIYL